MENSNIFTSFSFQIFLTIFLVKSKLSTAKKPKTSTFSRVFPQFFLTIFLVKSKLSTAKNWKIPTFSRIFHSKFSSSKFVRSVEERGHWQINGGQRNLEEVPWTCLSCRLLHSGIHVEISVRLIKTSLSSSTLSICHDSCQNDTCTILVRIPAWHKKDQVLLLDSKLFILYFFSSISFNNFCSPKPTITHLY